MNHKQEQIINYKPNYLNLNLNLNLNLIIQDPIANNNQLIFKEHPKCNNCMKVHYYKTDNDYCNVVNLFNNLNFKI
jgi:hypothetical protein